MEVLTIKTPSHTALVDITGKLSEVVHHSGIEQGICIVYIPHTTAGITINEHADPDVAADMLDYLDSTVPWERGWRHREGNSAAHIKTTLTGSSVAVEVTHTVSAAVGTVGACAVPVISGGMLCGPLVAPGVAGAINPQSPVPLG